MSTSYLALLRGINVGGKNKLPMKDLAALFVAAGCADVRTYIQSGNVVFHATPGRREAVCPWSLSKSPRDSDTGRRWSCGRSSSSGTSSRITRSSRRAWRGQAPRPVPRRRAGPGSGRRRSTRIDRRRTGSSCGAGRSSCTSPEGVADSKLTNAYFDSKLATVSTGRNWRTVSKLVELMR